MPDPTTVPVDLSPGAVLRRAATIIEVNGLHKGDYYQPQEGKAAKDSPVDPLGAISIAVGFDPVIVLWGDPDAAQAPAVEAADAAVEAAEAYLVSTGEEDGIDLAVWSDEPGRTATEVVAALRAAAGEVTADA